MDLDWSRGGPSLISSVNQKQISSLPPSVPQGPGWVMLPLQETAEKSVLRILKLKAYQSYLCSTLEIIDAFIGIITC